jgi:hypothetical protein
MQCISGEPGRTAGRVLPNKIQPKEYSMGGGTDGTLYISGGSFEKREGNRHVLCLYRDDDGSWNWNYNWVDNDNWNADNPAAVLATHFISLPYLGEFCFISSISFFVISISLFDN